MRSRLPERLPWLEHALQGLAFWIGHRHSLFNSYPLTEGALVAEACNLIQANIPRDLILLPECLYRNLVRASVVIDQISRQCRADLVLCSEEARPIGREGNISDHVRFVIEVKRGSAPKGEIDSDLSRLYHYLKNSDTAPRAFLIVISEGSAHRRFIKDGKSILGMHQIPACDGHFRIRRSVKAAASFSGKESAHYVSLIEVFRHKSEKVRPI